MQGDSNKEEPKMPVMPLNEKRLQGVLYTCCYIRERAVFHRGVASEDDGGTKVWARRHANT
jgi:hypothetical protein